jgi:nucleotide-binding universal stress UspA family protein
MKVLLAVDGSECSEAAVEEVARLPWPSGSEIRVISVVEVAPVRLVNEAWVLSPDYFEQWEKAALEDARATIDRATGRLKSAGLATSTTIFKGLPKEAIVDEAERLGADLIAMGSHGYTGLKRVWLGSVSLAVASHAPCSVLIVRDRRGDRTASEQ